MRRRGAAVRRGNLRTIHLIWETAEGGSSKRKEEKKRFTVKFSSLAAVYYVRYEMSTRLSSIWIPSQPNNSGLCQLSSNTVLRFQRIYHFQLREKRRNVASSASHSELTKCARNTAVGHTHNEEWSAAVVHFTRYTQGLLSVCQTVRLVRWLVSGGHGASTIEFQEWTIGIANTPPSLYIHPQVDCIGQHITLAASVAAAQARRM